MFCTKPCELAEALAALNQERIRELYMHGEVIPAPALFNQCPKGLTAKQAVNLHVWASWQKIIVPYKELAEALTKLYGIATTRVAIREIMAKLKTRGFFTVCEYSCEGFRQGMILQLSDKCCHWLLPQPLPHTQATPPAHTAPQGVTPPIAPAPTFAVTSAPPSSLAVPSLLLKTEQEDEEKSSLALSEEKAVQPLLANEFFAQAEWELANGWPHLRQIGFDFPAFMNAAKAAKDTALFCKTWRTSLDYAEFDLKHSGGMKEPDGTPVKNPRMWLFGCIRKSSHYPCPKNYRTAEEMALEAEKQSAAMALKQQEEELFTSAFEKWRASYSPEELRRIVNWDMGKSVPDPLLRSAFKKNFWPECKLHSLQDQGL